MIPKKGVAKFKFKYGNPSLTFERKIQLNSTQLTTPKEEWINKRKEAKKLIYIPDSLINSLDVS